ncbi:fungal-specific transcription factor domain-containing protein [Phyllosticta citrichinensis]|uniref:Fungal-specific transcription factor domain-containing protein n=1 Tax=Phyllosticta citrichinensis TaxID=1130410 RepID=A0ABR1Y7X7_9PEZI
MDCRTSPPASVRSRPRRQHHRLPPARLRAPAQVASHHTSLQFCLMSNTGPPVAADPPRNQPHLTMFQHPLTSAGPVNPSHGQDLKPAATNAPGPDHAPVGSPANLKPNACISCQKRKVKCDRTEPCSSCKRYRAVCEFRDPAPRRKRKLSDEDLHAKIDHYEHLLTQFGARVDSKSSLAKTPAAPAPTQPWAPSFTPLNARDQPRPRDPVGPPGTGESPATTKTPDNGRLVFEKGSSRYLESNLWKGIHDEIRDPKQLLHDAPTPSSAMPSTVNQYDPYHLDEGQLVLGLMQGYKLDLRSLHPQLHHIFTLWQAYLDNVNPLVKLLHTPTVQRQVLKAVSNLEAIDAETELLMFSIYLMAVVSMPSEECQALGESKQQLLTKFRYATKVALYRAGFLRSSDLVVLQAFILFLLAMRSYHDIHTQWSLTGLAIRMSQRIGLHKDGSKLGLPLFDIEMRRRVWWQLTPLEVRTSELAGGSISPLLQTRWDTSLPLNVNDSELNPDMKQLPPEHNGPTEMFFCLLRYKMGRFMRQHRHIFFSDFQLVPEGDDSLAERDRAIDEFEQMLETKFLRHCDPSVPLHYLTAIVARCALCIVRLLAHHPRQYTDKGKSLPQSEKDLLFATSLKTIELDNLAHGDTSLQRFLWHLDAYYQWDALIYLVIALRFRNHVEDKEIEKAWYQVNKTLEYHSQIVSDPDNPLHSAVGSLVAKAWNSYANEHARQNRPPPPIEDFKAVGMLVVRAKDKSVAESRGASGGPEAEARSAEAYQAAQPPQQQQTTPPVSASGWNTPLNNTDASPIDWDVWDGLLQEFGPQAGGFAVDLVG